MNVYTQKTRDAFMEGVQAAREQDFEKIKTLTYGRMNLEDTDENGRSLLHYAAEGGNLEIVRYLVLQCQMDPVWADKDLQTPYDLCSKRYAEAPQEKGYADILAFFKERLGFSLTEAYRNPVMRGFHADSSILRVGEDYYMVNSSFLFFPCIPISHSTDLVHWEVIGHAVTDAGWAQEHLGNLQGGRGFWAPDISYYEGRFYICATLRNNDDMPYPQTQMVTSAERPEGPYETPVIHNVRGIDPSIFTDEDGRRYMLLNRGARMHEISADGKEILSEAEMIAYGWSGHAPEGPHLLKKDGYYYLFLAEGGTGTGHMITVLRSKHLRGPYENCPYNPIMHQKDPVAGIQCCGHGKPVDTPDGRWYIAYLCSRMIDGKWGMVGRETCLDEIAWTPDGWPIINGGKGPSYLAKLPFPEKRQQRKETNPKWHFVRSMDMRFVQIEADGTIRIKGDGKDLNSMEARSLALYPQPDLVCSNEIHMEDVQKGQAWENGEEAGMTLYYDENTFIKFAVSKCMDAFEVIVSEYISENYVRTTRRKAAYTGSCTFRTETDGCRRTFFYNEEKIDSWADVTSICSEGLTKGKRFTSAMIGAYVYGAGSFVFM